MSEVVYSKIIEGGRVRCGHCGAEHDLLPPDVVQVLNSLWCDTCKQPSLLKPDEQLAYYRERAMPPAPAAETPTLVWNGSAYAHAGTPAATPAPATAPAAAPTGA